MYPPRTIDRLFVNIYVQLVLSVFAVLQVICLGFWAAPGTTKTRASVVAACLTVADAFALCVLSHLDHVRSIRPSLIINVYVLLSLPLDVARVRSLWLRGGSYPLAAAFTSTISVKVLVLIIEATDKRGILLSQYSGYSPESSSGIYSRSMFWWINPLLRDGFRKVLTDDDLYPVDATMSSEILQLQIGREWSKEKNKTKRFTFLRRTLWTLRWSLASAVFPRLCVTFFQYMQPFLIKAVLNFLQEPVNTQSTDVGWALTAAYGLDYLCLAIANAAFMHQTYRMVTTCRGAVVSMIYAQTVDLNLTSVDESAALTLMSTDVERIGLGLEDIHGIWAAMIEIAVGVFLLQRQIGLASLGPAILCGISGLTVLWIAIQFATKAQLVWVRSIQTRIDATSKMLGGMKAVKMLGLTDRMRSLVQQLRVDEIKSSMWYRKIIIIRLTLGKGSEVLAPGVAFAAFAAICNATGRPLEVANAYSSLSLVSLVAVPLARTIQSLPGIIAMVGCFDRIQDFLNLPAQRDHRLDNKFSTDIVNTSSDDTEPSSNIELRVMPKLPPADNNVLIEVEHASFAWNTSDPVIRDVSFHINQGSLTFVIGPVGSGKSTLLKGLIGETPSTEGFVYMKGLKAAFVDQTSWIQSGTLQSNILGISVYQREWYRSVVHACCLQDDIEILPKGDLTKVGSAGISLSGGQKQRLVSMKYLSK